MNEKNIKAILALVILLVAFSILLIFVNNQARLMAPKVFPLFMTLSTIALVLLTSLLFLVGKKTKSHHTTPRKSSSKKKRK